MTKQTEYWERNKESIAEKRNAKYANRSDEEKKKQAKSQKVYYKKWIQVNRDKWNQYNREYRANLRVQVLNKYSNGTMCCTCCSEGNIEFLCIDHINNDGAAHRKTFTGTIYAWLKANSYPEGFQVLCHNCNMSKEFYGYCPHMLQKT